MNVNHIQEIFEHYIDQFGEINNEEHDENYKWFAAKEYRAMMDDALALDGPEFAEALNKVKACTSNIIDNKAVQPFGGLVSFAKKEPETVKQMFLDLYSDDGGDIHVQEKLISDFFDKSNQLLEKHFAGSFRFKQNAHSVSAYLFLYDPDHHYMYKAEQSKKFADCIEFYDDWGSGDNINLEIYYRMCDWVVDQINRSPALLAKNKTRFEIFNGDQMFPDEKKHILTFDLIYCCSVYDLFSGISYQQLNSEEKKIVLENREKAQALYEEYLKAVEEKNKLDEAMLLLAKNLKPGGQVFHKNYGVGEIKEYDENNDRLKVKFADGEKIISPSTVFGMKILKTEEGKLEKSLEEYLPYLKDEKNVISHVKQTENALNPYKEYLE